MHEPHTSGTEAAAQSLSVRRRWRVTVSWREASTCSGVRRARTPGEVRRRLVVALGATGLALGVTALPASASSNGGSTSATINVEVRSLTVSPGTTTFDACFLGNTGPQTAALGFPNGICLTSPPNAVTVTNGPVPDHIDVQGSDAIPADLGTHWTLCDGTSGPTGCTGTGGLPGVDQFSEFGTQQSVGLGPLLSNSPECDASFGNTCPVVGADQQGLELLDMTGPTVSTDNSPTFTTTWTWTALP